MCTVTPAICDERIGNFDILIHRFVNLHTDSQPDGVPHVEISVVFEKGPPSEKKMVALSKLAATNWIALDYRVSVSPHIATATANRYIADAVRSALEDFPTTDVYRLGHLGLHIINGEPMFYTGKEVIRPSSSNATQGPAVECGPMSQWLDFNPDLSEADAAAEMLNLISLFPDPGRIILTQVVIAFLRQAYEDAGKSPSFCVFLYGSSGTQKTAIASFLTQVYNRNDGIIKSTRLNASCASAVEMLMDVVDQVKVFDDLFPADSTQVRKKQEKTLSEITRYIGDGTIPTRMKGTKVQEGRPKCGVLFTGEYLIGRGSDATRLLPVEMTKPDKNALMYFQKQPLIVSTFYRNFISWFIENYGEIVSYLKEWLVEYHKTELGVHDRLRETHFFLNTAYALLLEYCEAKGVLSKEEVLRFHKCFVVVLTQLVREQNERVSPTESVRPIQGSVLKRIRELYLNHQFHIQNNKKQFDDNLHDGVIHTGCLCLRPKALTHYFPGNDDKDIAHKLDVEGALIKGRDSLTQKISAARGNYFYWIPLDRLNSNPPSSSL